MSDDPVYVDVDYEGNPLGQDGRPKWSIPETDFQCRVLAICKRKYFSGKHEKGELNLIDHSMYPWTPGQTVPKYPSGWIDNILAWAGKKNEYAGYQVIGVQGILTAINNEDNKQNWIDQQLRKENKTEKEPDYGSSPYGNN